MPRAHRYFLPGYVYHITHRCHNSDFLLRSALDRDVYRKWLLSGVGRFKVSVLGYCLTCNHIHLILFSKFKSTISGLMQFVQGCTAQQYNKRKGRSGAFWQDRYHCTIVETGKHLWNCLLYIDLNMVRAGRVKSPAGWDWCGYGELAGLRKRYKVINVRTLLEKLEFSDINYLRDQYIKGIQYALKARQLCRDPMWTESLAVGDKTFIDGLMNQFGRLRIYKSEEYAFSGSKEWTIRECEGSYSQF